VTVRTYHARRGRLSEHRLDVLARLVPAYGVAVGDTALDLPRLYGRRAALVVEIGSGMGEAIVEMATADPDRDYLAVEVHTAGVANLLAMIEQDGLTNVRVARGNALHLVGQQLAPDSVDAIHAFFPDPWPKTRHHKRRLVQPSNVAILRSRLVPGGLLHVATDWPDYAVSMMDALVGDDQLVNPFPGYAARGGRPVTKYEQRAREAGRDVFDLTFHRSRPGQGR
jgi:tRNA (guanine-N7-)-methyltransferase